MIVTKAINSPLAFTVVGLIDPLFKMTVDTTQAGSAADTFVIPLQSTVNNFVVYWGDGTSETVGAVTSVSHTYSAASILESGGVYQITMDGAFSGLRFGGGGDRLKLSSIDNWGVNQWLNFDYSFHSCSNMVANYTDNPDTTLVTNMSRSFFGCTNFNGTVDFDTSSVGLFDYMFYLCSNFNQSINWDTTSAGNFSHTFHGCSSLNSSFSLSNTSNVSTMSAMFTGCSVFNQPINFNTLNVVSVAGMFISCSAFNQPITFNAPICSSTSSMFNGCVVLNSTINITSSSLLKNCSYMMKACFAFNSSITISDTSGVTNMTSMFQQCTVFDQDISSLQINALTTAANMMLLTSFSKTNYDLLLPAWDAYGTSGVTFHAGTAHYSVGAPTTAHDAMVARGWTITDGGTP